MAPPQGFEEEEIGPRPPANLGIMPNHNEEQINSVQPRGAIHCKGFMCLSLIIAILVLYLAYIGLLPI